MDEDDKVMEFSEKENKKEFDTMAKIVSMMDEIPFGMAHRIVAYLSDRYLGNRG